MVNHQMRGLTRINRKVDLNAAMVSYNSYKLNAQSNRTLNKDSK
jgi:hypothetical protein